MMSEPSINSGESDFVQDQDRVWPFFEEDEKAAALAVLQSGKVNYWTGCEGRLFEQEFADFVGVSHAIAVANGTIALELALKACGIGSGDEVIVPSRTFVATANAVVACGACPVFADIDSDTGNISTHTLEAVRDQRTKAVIPVHVGGMPCDMPVIMQWAARHGLIVIEDCAQSHGAGINGQRTGSFGQIGCFSFCQDKLMTTAGEGGMIVTSDTDLHRKIWQIKDHGKNLEKVLNPSKKPGFRWLHDEWGTNGRLSEIQAAIGRVQLRKLPGWLQHRQRNAEILDAALEDIPVVRIFLPAVGVNTARYKYYALLNPTELRDNWTRDRILAKFREAGFESLTGGCCEVYREAHFGGKPHKARKRLPVAAFFQDNSLMFEIHPGRSHKRMEQIAREIRKILLQASDNR